MRKLVIVLPVALAVLLALFLWSREEPQRRATRDRAGGLLPGEKLRAVEEDGWLDERPELDEPVFLRGRVFDPNGRPVRKAEVMVRWPRTWNLVDTNADGEYELPFERPGRYLVEAQLGLDLAPAREIVEIPEVGAPPRVDFRLEPAGHVFGEVLVGGTPLFAGYADIGVVDKFGDVTWELDTDCDNGFFNFYWEPPRQVTLRLVIRSRYGFMKNPVEFKFTGERLDLGRVVLKRYPTLLLKMRLPDGSYAREVQAALASDLEPSTSVEYDDGLPPSLTNDSRLVIQRESDVSQRFVFWDAERGCKVVRDVLLVFDQLHELEVHVRPGPLVVRRRLVDEHGYPIRARVALGKDRAVETGLDGYFSVDVPHGGVHTLHLTALHDPGLGWIPLPASERWPRTGLLLDADDSRAECVLPLDGRVLVVGVAPAAVLLAGERASADELPAAWRVFGTNLPAGLFGALSPRLTPGRYTWSRLQRSRTTRGLDWAAPRPEEGVRFAVAERGLTVVDAR